MKYATIISNEKEKTSFLKKIEKVPMRDSFLEKKTYEAYQKLKKYTVEEKILLEEISVMGSLLEYQVGLAIKVRFSHFSSLSFLSSFGFIIRERGDDFFWIRYVGFVPANIIWDRGISLEEYHTSFSCILVVNKPAGITSFDVVRKISDIYGLQKVGHTGTLDPMATGVLLVTVGRAVRIAELLTAHDKEYIASVELGYETDTYDSMGEVVARGEVPKNLLISEVLQSFQKTYSQEVPIYSAIKIKGKKLYEYAREKKEIDLPCREVTIKDIQLLEEKCHSFTFRVLVSKGCYIRSLIRDIGLELGVYTTMTSLERTRQGCISIDQANTLEEVEKHEAKEYAIEEVLDYPKVVVSGDLEKKVRNGVRISNEWNILDKVFFKTKDNQLIGIYEVEGEELITWKNFT